MKVKVLQTYQPVCPAKYLGTHTTLRAELEKLKKCNIEMKTVDVGVEISVDSREKDGRETIIVPWANIVFAKMYNTPIKKEEDKKSDDKKSSSKK